MRSWGSLLLAALLLAPTAAFSREPLRFAQRWDDLSPEQQERAMRNYERYRKLTPEKRKDLEQRYEKWKGLPSADKDRYRKKFKDYLGQGLVDD